MKLDLRDRCHRPKCLKLIRQGKTAQANWRRYQPYCSYHCAEWHRIENALVYLKGRRQEAVRDEVLEEAAVICENHAIHVSNTEDAYATCVNCARDIRALKREPNAAGEQVPYDGVANKAQYEAEALHASQAEPDHSGEEKIYTKADAEAMCEVAIAADRTAQQMREIREGRGNVGTADPAPAAPDVESMVKRLESEAAYHELHGFIETKLLLRQAAALLAKLGQGWIPVSGYAEARARFGGEGVKADKHSNAFTYFVDSKTQWFAIPLPPAPGASDD